MRVKASPCSEDEWEQVLSSILLGRGLVPDVDATAATHGSTSLIITFHKRVQTITVSGRTQAARADALVLTSSSNGSAP